MASFLLLYHFLLIVQQPQFHLSTSNLPPFARAAHLYVVQNFVQLPQSMPKRGYERRKFDWRLQFPGIGFGRNNEGKK